MLPAACACPMAVTKSFSVVADLSALTMLAKLFGATADGCPSVATSSMCIFKPALLGATLVVTVPSLSSESNAKLPSETAAPVPAGISTGLQLEAIGKKREVIRAEMDNIMRTLQEQVETEWIQFNAAQARLPALEKSWLAAEQTAKAWDRQFLAGRKSWMELMNTVRELMQAHLDLVDAQALLLVSSWRLACLAESTELAVQKMQETGALRP